MEQSTVDAVSKIYEAHGSYRKTAKAIGVSHSVVFNVLRRMDHLVNRAKENQLRLTLGLPSLPPKVEVDACPDCGGCHTGRCKGKKVAIRPVSQRIYNTVWSMPTSQLAKAIRERVEV